MASQEWEDAGDLGLAPMEPPHSQSAADWIAENEDVAVERLFALLEQNQAAIAALAQAWRHTRRALDLTRAELDYAKRTLALERRTRGQLAVDETPHRSHAVA